MPLPTMTAAGRAQFLRVARIIVTGLLAQPAISSLISSTLVRYPVTVAVIAAVEVIYHALTEPVPAVVPGSRLTPQHAAGKTASRPDAELGTLSGAPSDTVYTPVTQPTAAPEPPGPRPDPAPTS
jgi:hypothetical protein